MDKKVITCQKAVERINKKIDLQKQKLKDLKSELRKTKEALKMAKKKPMKGGGGSTSYSTTNRADTSYKRPTQSSLLPKIKENRLFTEPTTTTTTSKILTPEEFFFYTQVERIKNFNNGRRTI